MLPEIMSRKLPEILCEPHELESVFPGDRNNLRVGGAGPCATDLYMDWPVLIAGWSVPKSVSWIALIVTGGFALFAFRLFAEHENH